MSGFDPKPTLAVGAMRAATYRNPLLSVLNSTQGHLMTLSDFATFSTAISGLAVTASLIYLALQTHQNSKHSRALIQQGRAAQFQDLISQWAADPALAEVVMRGGAGDLTMDPIQNYR